MPLLASLWTLLRLPNFRRLLAVRLLSQHADGIFQVALATYVVFSPENETSAAAIAGAMAVLLLPYSLLGPFAGVLLDRWRRRQVLLFGNLLRAALAAGTALLIINAVPTWLFYLSALSVTAVNRFILAGLSAALPRVVDRERLVMANALSPTAGTVAAAAGGSVAFVVRLLAPDGINGDSLIVIVGALVYLLAGVVSLRMGRELLGPESDKVPGTSLRTTVTGTARGLAAGLRHLAERPLAARTLTAMTLMRFCYGALTVTFLMLCRYAWADGSGNAPQSGSEAGTGETGLKWLGLAVGISALGFLAAALITPWIVSRTGQLTWITICAAVAALLEPGLGLPFAPVPMLVAAFVLGLVTQASKITTDTVVQHSVDDDYRGRVFALYDMLFNIAFVGAAGVAALMLPADGRSSALVLTVASIYAAVAVGMARFSSSVSAT